MAKKFVVPIDLNKLELQNPRIQNLAADPGSPVEGQIYYNTVSKKKRTFNGTTWDEDGSVATAVTQTSNSGGAGRMKVSAGADRTIGDYAGGAGIVKSDADGVVSAAAAGTDYVTNGSSGAFTNKSFDANGSGNSISNLETADFAANVIDTDGTLAANSDTRIASQKAVKTYVDIAIQGVKWKASVRVATTAAGTLASSFENGDTIDGVVLATGDRILIKDQADPKENGIYTVNASGAPTRALDSNTSAEIPGSAVGVMEGTANAEKAFINTNDATFTLGSDNVTYVSFVSALVPAASTTVEGKVELATLAETEAKSDTGRAVTPSGLANFPIKKTFTIGDTSTTSFALTHSLGTKDVVVSVRSTTTDDQVIADVNCNSTSQVTISFAVAPGTNEYTVTVIG